MGDQRKHGISWTEETWNPIRGCSRVSEGCRNCYAEKIAGRFSGKDQPYHGLAVLDSRGARWTGTVKLVEEHLDDPIRWTRPRRIFVNAMSDLFHEELDPHDIASIFAVMACAPQHTYQVLTKRADVMNDLLNDPLFTKEVFTRANDRGRNAGRWPLENVWLGVSVENQAAAAERIPLLLATRAKVRWLSVEPMLSAVSVIPWIDPIARAARGLDPARLDWIVCGGESGPDFRPMSVYWATELRDECIAHGIPFHFKQWSGVRPKKLGRLLEGREWNEYPSENRGANSNG